MRGAVENVVGRASLADSSAVHDDDLVSHLSDDAQIVGNDDDGHVELLLKFLHQLEDLCLDGNVQSGCRFIRDEDVGLGYQRHGDHDTLTHTARELVRILLKTFCRVVDSDQFQHTDGSFFRLIPRFV